MGSRLALLLRKKRMKLKSDRFIPDTPDDLLRKEYKTQTFPQRTQKDSHLNKLYRILILKEGKRNKNKEKEREENFMKNKSLKCIDFNYQNTGENQNKNSYQYLNLLGLNISNIQLGPTIVNKPEKLLAAQNLIDDFYLNLIDCSVKSILAVGLSKGIYLWKTSGAIAKLQTQQGLTSLQWSPKKPHLLASGSSVGDVSIYDCEKNECIARYEEHKDRVGTIGWLNNENNLLSGGKDNKIFLYDLRKRKATSFFKFHQSQICTIKVSMNGNNTNQVFASGSNDKKLAIWNMRMKKPEIIYQHEAAVKGIAWHPIKQGILASGGGSEDRCLRIWDNVQNSMVKCIETGSQICNLMFIKNGNFLVSSHGYNKFQTNIWQYESNQSIIKRETLVGHTNRVLYLTAFPKGDLIVTGAGDQTIRFWKFNEQKQSQTHKELQDTNMTIR